MIFSATRIQHLRIGDSPTKRCLDRVFRRVCRTSIRAKVFFRRSYRVSIELELAAMADRVTSLVLDIQLRETMSAVPGTETPCERGMRQDDLVHLHRYDSNFRP